MKDVRFFVRAAIDPTQSWGEFLQHPVATPIEAFQPGVTRLPPVLARMILSTPGGNAEPAAARARLLQSLQNVRDARRAGVPVVAGTDKGVPGFSVQREIELYVDGGMTPLEALQAATIVPARVMRLEKETGTIEAGKRADLLVLDGNPLENIANIRRGVWVVANGKNISAVRQAAGRRRLSSVGDEACRPRNGNKPPLTRPIRHLSLTASVGHRADHRRRRARLSRA